jgi:cytochrome c556
MNGARMTAIVVCVSASVAGAGYLNVSTVMADNPFSSAPPHMAHGASNDGLDTRTPLPLTAMMAEHQKQNMRDHLAAVQEIVAALAADDMSAVEKAARRIGYSDGMVQMCQHMGAGAPGFADLALTFHRTADTIADAAQHGDRKAATAALAATLSTCVGCHAAYRQQVVDDATWRRLTDGSAK